MLFRDSTNVIIKSVVSAYWLGCRLRSAGTSVRVRVLLSLLGPTRKRAQPHSQCCTQEKETPLLVITLLISTQFSISTAPHARHEDRIPKLHRLKPHKSPQLSPTDARLAASTGQRPREKLSSSRLPSDFSFSLELPSNLFSSPMTAAWQPAFVFPVSLGVSDRQPPGAVPRAAGDSLPSEVSGPAGLTQPPSFGRRLE